MAEASATPTPENAPSVFLSYSSDDRAAARALRDGLEAAGLVVWYDESELGGGDAWDQKIRRQIRECHYFMPVISASTERRSEGYFRREWKLAVERTHDMADDVLFLVPVVIDDTGDGGARVPEKFLTVQWQRIPGGQPGPALTALARKLLAGESTPPVRPPPVRGGTRPPLAQPEGPPPMPPFPPKPADGHKAHYVAQVFWWILTVLWLLFKRLPRILRILVAFMVLTSLWKCTTSRSNNDDTPTPKHPPKTSSVDKQALKQVVEDAKKDLAQPGQDNATVSDLMRAGAKIADTIAAELDKDKLVPGQIGVAEFGPAFKPSEREPVEALHSALFGQLAIARPASVKPLVGALPTGSDAELLALAAKSGDTFVVVARPESAEDGDVLIVRLLKTADSATLWSGRYRADEVSAPATVKAISQAILDATEKK